MFRITLVSMPWPLFNRPSLQLAALRSYLLSKRTDLEVSIHPAYLEIAAAIGLDFYHEISQNNWFAEAAYASLLFPEKEGSVRSLLSRPEVSGKWPRQIPFNLERLTSRLEAYQSEFLQSRPWGEYNLAGFTICLNQLTSSLYAIRTLKDRFPGLKIVAGGSSCSGEMGRSLLTALPEIDFMVTGEGEKPLLSVVDFLQGKSATPGLGVFYRNSQGIAGGGYDEITDLNSLPVPDYEEYFRSLNRVFKKVPFLPVLPLEFSRGCWWGKCRFCNLNIQWHSCRKKSKDRVLEEIDTITGKYPSIDLAFTDNSLPPRDGPELCAALSDMGKDFEIFAELRADQSFADLSVMRRAGVATVQVGVEALSSSLLRRMGKGITAIQNIEIMRNCEELGIIQSGNLIAMFPGSTAEEVRETLNTLDYVLPYYPLKIARFWLGFGSPVHCAPSDYGLRGLKNHHFYKALLPDHLYSGLVLMNRDYQGEKKKQALLWRPVQVRVKQWYGDYFTLRSRYPSRPLLSYRDGGSLLIIRQALSGNSVLIHRLRGASRKIYLFCTSSKGFNEIQQNHSGHPTGSLRKFLDELVEKRLMFREEDRYLSLAVRENRI
ncbi:MAG: RiPP maturation radical SAM C-methyltransferase [Pseudomonadota bacterium]